MKGGVKPYGPRHNLGAVLALRIGKVFGGTRRSASGPCSSSAGCCFRRRLGSRRFCPWRRLGDRLEPVGEEEDGVEPGASIPPRCVRHGGMSLHADVAVPAHDRKRLERLCRYGARPPLALDRLEATSDGRLAYRLKTPWRDGTTHVVMERRELLERLAPLIPPPRAHQVRYHGILAPCASGRDRIVPGRDAKEPGPHAANDDPWRPVDHSSTRIDRPNDGLDTRPAHGANIVPLPTSAARLPGQGSDG